MQPKSLMIVDDSTVMRKLIAQIFMDNKHISIKAEAANGEEALKQLRTVNPDLILLDIEMPKMDGLEFLRRAKLRCAAKIVILSSVAAVGSERASKAVKLGADAIISKPSGTVSFDIGPKCGEEITNTVSKLLGLH